MDYFTVRFPGFGQSILEICVNIRFPQVPQKFVFRGMDVSQIALRLSILYELAALVLDLLTEIATSFKKTQRGVQKTLPW